MHNSNSDKIGLVLSGGLFRNAFQVGVLEALSERKFVPQVVIGVSSGAWNGACLVAGQIQQMREFWLQVGEAPKVTLRNIKFNRTIFNLHSIVHEIPKRQLDFKKILQSSTEFYVGVTKVRNFQAHYFYNHEKIRDFFPILVASSWLPVLYARPVQIDGCYYMDGGFTDNVPYEMAFSANCKHVYIIVPNHDGRIFKKWWPQTHFIPKQYRSRITVIAPKKQLPSLCIKKHQIEEAMEEGYHVGQKISL